MYLCFCSARYRGRGTDLSKVASFQNSDKDTGSTAVQIARLSARVEQLTAHLKEHRKVCSQEQHTHTSRQMAITARIGFSPCAATPPVAYFLAAMLCGIFCQ